MGKKKIAPLLALAALLCSCGREKGAGLPDARIPQVPGMRVERELPVEYARMFSLFRYEGGCTMVAVRDGRAYLVVPPGAEAPAAVPEGVSVICQPLGCVYVAASAAMALWRAVGALPQVRFCSTLARDWYIPDAVAALKDGGMEYAGKYSAPDYELLLARGCDLAVESGMILHSPKVQEKLESLGIPVFIDRSSYEDDPLGRMEWVRVYGILAGREAEADQFFSSQTTLLAGLAEIPNTEQTVAFFYVNQNGMAVVRRQDDYIPRMVELAGGRYVPRAGQGSPSPSVTLSMEEFYQSARDADFLVYNASIGNPLRTRDDLLAKSPLFADFAAVRAGNVWTTDRSMYQAADSIALMVRDLHALLSGSGDGMAFLERVE